MELEAAQGVCPDETAMIATMALMILSGASRLSMDAAFPPPADLLSTQKAGAASPQDKQKAQLERDIADDIKLGDSYAAEIAKELKPSDDQEGQARLDRVGGELAAIANSTPVDVLWGDKRHTHFPYKFILVKGKDVNAFSIPGGRIYVYDGLLDFVESDDELAAVLGHEISHASFRHLAVMRHEQAKYSWLQLPLLIAVALSRSPDAGNVLAASQYAMQGLTSGWSVKAETAADFGGIQYELKSKYNPVGALTFMERLAHRDLMSMKVDWGIFQTHPPSDDRADFIMDELHARGIVIRRSEVATSFAVQIKPAATGGLELWFGRNRIHTFRGAGSTERSQIAQIRLNAFFDVVPEVFGATLQDQTFLYGNGRPLFEVTDQDASGTGQGKQDLAKQALANLKRCLLDLSYRVYKPRRFAN